MKRLLNCIVPWALSLGPIVHCSWLIFMMDPRQMEKMMRQMGIKTKQIESSLVTIETSDGKILITEPQVTEVDMQGQKTYQIAGSVKFETGISEEDVKMVMEQANCSKEQATDALKQNNGDIAQAILSLQEQKKP